MTYEDRDTWIKNKLREQKEIEERTQPNYNSTLEMFKPPLSYLDKQIGGDHYKDCEIQPVEYIVKNNLFCDKAGSLNSLITSFMKIT